MKSRIGVAMVAIAAAGWGTWSWFLYNAGLPAQISNVIVFAVMGVVAFPFGLREPRATWDRTAVVLLVANALCDVLNSLFFFQALAHTSVAIAVITHYAAPILIALAAPQIDRVTTRGARPAAAIALVGLVLVLEPWHTHADSVLLGAVFGFTSAIFYAANVFVVRRLATRIGTLRAISYHALIGAVLTLPWALPYVDRVTPDALAYLVAGAVLLGIGSNTLFIGGLQRIGAGRTAVLTFAEPLVAVLFGVVKWDQPIGWLALVGGALVLASGVHVARQAR